MDLKQTIYANAFNLLPELGPVRLKRLFAAAPDLQVAWDTWPTQRYCEVGLEPHIAEKIITGKAQINPHTAYDAMVQAEIRLIGMTDSEYPPLLSEIASHPPLLYIRGNPACLRQYCIGVVGTRKVSAYGKQVILKLIPDLAAQKINIASGLAFGVDAEALTASLDCGMQPVAVLATSLNDAALSPRSNFILGKRIVEQGCLISEYPLGSQVNKGNFPVRNRLISGLSVGTLVIEADEKSGSLITAAYALDQNRAVFAVPGSIFSDVSRGTHQLLKRGAKMVTDASDITEELNLDLQIIKSTVTVKATETEVLLLNVLSKQQKTLDELIRETKLSPSQASIALSMLELNGRVKNLGNGAYAKIL